MLKPYINVLCHILYQVVTPLPLGSSVFWYYSPTLTPADVSDTIKKLKIRLDPLPSVNNLNSENVDDLCGPDAYHTAWHKVGAKKVFE